MQNINQDESLLNYQSQVAGIESLSVHLPNKPMLTSLSSLAKDVMSYMSEKINALQDNISSIVVRDTIADNGLDLKVLSTAFLYPDVMDVELPIPEKLSITYLEYADLILSAQKITMSLYDDVLYPISKYLGEAIQYPDKLKTMIRNSSVKLGSTEVFLQKMDKAFSSSNQVQLYKNVIKKQSDWVTLDRKISDILSNEKKQPRELVYNKVEDINNLLNILIEGMLDTNKQYRPTTAVINDLAAFTYELAEQITFYSMIENSIDSFINILKSSKEKMLSLK